MEYLPSVLSRTETSATVLDGVSRLVERAIRTEGVASDFLVVREIRKVVFNVYLGSFIAALGVIETYHEVLRSSCRWYIHRGIDRYCMGIYDCPRYFFINICDFQRYLFSCFKVFWNFLGDDDIVWLSVFRLERNHVLRYLHVLWIFTVQSNVDEPDFGPTSTDTLHLGYSPIEPKEAFLFLHLSV